MIEPDDPSGVYVNDPAYFRLTQSQQRALRHGQLTPREARDLLRPLLPLRLALIAAYEKQLGSG